MTNKDHIFDILSKYEMKIENLQIEVINAQKVLHPNFPGLFIKFDLPKNIPNEKRKDIKKKLMEKTKKENQGVKCFFIKETHELNEDFVNKVISEARMEGDKEKELEGLRMRVLLSEDFNPIDMYLNNYKRGFNELFSLFENCNNDLIYHFKGLTKNEILKKRSIHFIYKIKNEYNSYLDLEIENEFKQWKKLVEYFYLRHILVHRDGLIDDKFIEDLKKNLEITTINHYQRGTKIQITPEIFNKAVSIILEFLKYIKIKI